VLLPLVSRLSSAAKNKLSKEALVKFWLGILRLQEKLAIVPHPWGGNQRLNGAGTQQAHVEWNTRHIAHQQLPCHVFLYTTSSLSQVAATSNGALTSRHKP
jgi:hypothetical protein